MNRGDSASPCPVRRSRRPQARLETSCTRTGRPRRHLRGISCRSAGEGSGHTARMHVCEESDCGIVPMNHSNKDGTSSAESEEGRLRIKENTFNLTRARHRAGKRVSQVTGVRTSDTLGRYSEIRTGCANERPSGSVRGATGNGVPTATLLIVRRHPNQSRQRLPMPRMRPIALSEAASVPA